MGGGAKPGCAETRSVLLGHLTAALQSPLLQLGGSGMTQGFVTLSLSRGRRQSLKGGEFKREAPTEQGSWAGGGGVV